MLGDRRNRTKDRRKGVLPTSRCVVATVVAAADTSDDIYRRKTWVVSVGWESRTVVKSEQVDGFVWVLSFMDTCKFKNEFERIRKI